MPGSVHIDLFSSLDGVMQAPGRVDEDPSGGFAFGGWQARFEDDVVGERVIAGIRAMDALLLGRRTYEIFAGYWPRISGAGPAGEIARLFNALPKYVASRGDRPLGWNNSHLLGLDLGREIAALRGRHTEVHVVGSIDLARTLVAERWFDVLNLWIYRWSSAPARDCSRRRARGTTSRCSNPLDPAAPEPSPCATAPRTSMPPRGSVSPPAATRTVALVSRPPEGMKPATTAGEDEDEL